MNKIAYLIITLAALLAGCGGTVVNVYNVFLPSPDAEVAQVSDARTLPADAATVADGSADAAVRDSAQPEASTDSATADVADASLEAGANHEASAIPDAATAADASDAHPSVDAETDSAAVPTTTVSIMRSESMRASSILVADTGNWENVAEYRITATGAGVTADLVRVRCSGVGATYTEVAIAVDRRVRGTCILPAGEQPACDIRLQDPFYGPLVVPANTPTTFQVWVKLARLVPRSLVPTPIIPNATDVALSGNLVRAGIAIGYGIGEWDSNYRSRLNVRLTETVSGRRVYADGDTSLSNLPGNTFVVRNSKPTIQRQPIASPILHPGENILFVLQLSADSTRPIAWKRMRFNVTIVSSTFQFARFRLMRNGFYMSQNDYQILDGHGNDLYSGSVTTGSTDVIVRLRGEEMIYGSGFVYRIAAELVGTVRAEDATWTILMRDLADSPLTTGALIDTSPDPSALPGPFIRSTRVDGSLLILDGSFLL